MMAFMTEAIVGKHTGKSVVIGGGVAGLVAAVELARGGAKVVLLESAAQVGGRARTHRVGGFSFNQGAHALYTGGAFRAALKRFDIAIPGNPPDASTPYMALYRGKLEVLPRSLGSLARTGLLSVGDKLAFARIQTFIEKGDRPMGSFAAWLDGERLSPALRATIEAFARLSTYGNAPNDMSAAAALDQIRMAIAGVVYVDGGWSTLIDGLADRARAAGVEIRPGASVASVTPGNDGVRIALADGDQIVAPAALLALGPQEAHALLPVASLQQAVAEARPARANVLDLGLERLPDGAAPRVQGVDRPLYFSLHSNAAKLAPEGAALVHIARYLAPDEKPAPDAIAELEALADLAMPGWRPLERQRQRLIGMPVSHGVPRWDVKRPGVRLADAPGVFIAGDWVGDVGMISDAAAASGAEAAKAMLMHASPQARAAA
jgi:phytoene dehydrogenase-like protein